MSDRSLSEEMIAPLLRRLAEGLPNEIRAQSRHHILDTLGISIAAAYGSMTARQTVDGLSVGAGGGSCRVIGYGHRLAPPLAACANSALAHAMDYDDSQDYARLHLTSVTFPTALAAADIADCSIGRVIDAVALGNEIMSRMGAMLKPVGEGPGSNWFLSQLFGYVGAALVAGVVLGLTEAQIVSAIGLAYMQMAGGKEAAFSTGATSRSIYTSFASQAGIQSALIARAGVQGPYSALDGKTGLFRQYIGIDLTPAQRAELTDAPGWLWADTQVKLFPSCRHSHPYVAAGFALRKQVALDAIEHILVEVNQSTMKLCQPLAERLRPRTLPDAKYSIPFMTAFALVRGRVDLLNMDESIMADQAVLDVARKVEVVASLPDLPGLPPGRVTIRAGGKTYSHYEALEQSASAEQLRNKFLTCFEYANVASFAPALWTGIMEQEDASVAKLMNQVPVVKPT